MFQESELASRRQHPGDLGHGPGNIHPVPRLSKEDHIDAAVGQRDLLRTARQGRHIRQDPDQFGAHSYRRLDGHHREATVRQLPGQLTCTGPKIEDGQRAGW